MDVLTVGVEEEFQVVDLSTGQLVPRADELVAQAQPVLGTFVTQELNLCQVETGSPVCTTLDQIGAALRGSRRMLADVGTGVGVGIAAVGTHPTGRWQQQQVDRDTPRFRRMEERYQVVAREQIICGCHVHVGVPDPDLRVATMSRLRPWLPVLLALSANSPFWQGRDTGYASYRDQIWQRWPTAGMPPVMGSMEEYDQVVRELVDVGALDDASYVYWYARPSLRFPTIEVRVCDTLLRADDAVVIAGLTRALVWSEAQRAAREAPADDPRSTVLDAAMWHASRYGTSGSLVSPLTGTVRKAGDVVAELLAHVRDGLDAHGDRELVTEGAARILRTGTGADRQRALLADADPLTIMEPVRRTTVSAA